MTTFLTETDINHLEEVLGFLQSFHDITLANEELPDHIGRRAEIALLKEKIAKLTAELQKVRLR